MKIIIILISFLFPISGFAQGITPIGKIMNVSAPSLGITSSTVVLLWDDTYIPDYTNMDIQLPTRMYHIYRDGIKIGSTKQRSYPVKGLTASSTYLLKLKMDRMKRHIDDPPGPWFEELLQPGGWTSDLRDQLPEP